MYEICVHQVAAYVDESGAVASGTVASGVAMAPAASDQVGLSFMSFIVNSAQDGGAGETVLQQ